MALNKKQFRFYIVLVLLLIVGGFLVWWKLNYPKEEIRVEEIGITRPKEKSPIQRGIDFLFSTNERFVGGATWVIKKLNEICQDEGLENLWKRKLNEDIKDQKFLYRLYNPDYQTDFDLENIPDLNTRIVAKAAYCEKFSYENISQEIKKFKKDNAYNSTHLLLALAIMKEKGCYDETLLTPLIEGLINDLITAQDKEGEPEKLPYLCNPYYLDIYAERAAVIGYAGYPIKEAWVENILRCQRENGSWFDSPHTTSLALWAVAQKNRDCQ